MRFKFNLNKTSGAEAKANPVTFSRLVALSFCPISFLLPFFPSSILSFIPSFFLSFFFSFFFRFFLSFLPLYYSIFKTRGRIMNTNAVRDYLTPWYDSNVIVIAFVGHCRCHFRFCFHCRCHCCCRYRCRYSARFWPYKNFGIG